MSDPCPTCPALQQQLDAALVQQTRLAADVHQLNAAIRSLGWGQGEIDEYASRIEGYEALREAATNILTHEAPHIEYRAVPRCRLCNGNWPCRWERLRLALAQVRRETQG